jgi:hypothetical protein
MRGQIILLASLLALGLGGCEHAKKQFVLPAAPQPAVKAPLPQARIETPPPIDTPVPMVEFPVPIDVEPPPPPVEEKPKPPHTPPVQATSPEVQPPAPPPVVPPPPTPRLGEILTDDRRREYEKEFTTLMAEARAAVHRANGRRLNAVQREMLDRIRVFLQQADSSRDNDLPAALQFARRADVLGQDLVKSLP